MTPAELTAQRLKVARKFLQSALVIDDDLELAPISSEPLVANPPAASIVKPVNIAAHAAADKAAASEAQATMQIAKPPRARVDVKAITDAFLPLSVICGTFRPGPDDDAASLSSGAAAHADIVIVDWFLEGQNSTRAKEMIRHLLTEDAKRRDRLRLLVVYTSNPGRGIMATELLAFLNESVPTNDRFVISGGALTGPATRIVFLNKDGTVGGDSDALDEAALPERIVSEFATLIEGLLPTFGVAAIAAMREAAPHILALFNRSLDGAFVGHRLALVDPEDSENFAADILTDELRNVIEVNEVSHTHLSAEAVGAWIEAQHGRTFGNGVNAIAASDLKLIASEGKSRLTQATQVSFADPTKPGSTSERIGAADVGRVFYDDDESALSGNMRLARLSALKNEAHAETRMPVGWRPFLSLGTILMPRVQSVEGVTEFLICLQPSCDSVRLGSPTKFPFQTARTASRFNLVVRHAAESAGVKVQVDSKPRDASIITFAPDPVKKRVVASMDAAGTYVFVDSSNVDYLWVGDLKAMKAQAMAAAIASRMNIPGLDDFEWLRAAASKVKD